MAKRNHYDSLGVKPNSDAATIKKAYHRRVRSVHPDTGGTKEEFLAVQLAYETLSDPGRRQRYDETGDDGSKDRSQSSAMSDAINLIISRAGMAGDVAIRDLIAEARESVYQTMRELEADILDSNAQRDRYRNAAQRFKCKEENNLMKSALENHAERFTERAADAQRRIQHGKDILDVLSAYNYTTEIPVW